MRVHAPVIRGFFTSCIHRLNHVIVKTIRTPTGFRAGGIFCVLGGVYMKGKGRGFASMDPERRKEVSSLGGKKAQASGKAHRWNSEEARAAGKKGKKHDK